LVVILFLNRSASSIMIRLKTCICYFLLGLLLQASGAVAQLKEETIRFSEGLPSDFVKQLILDNKGFLILATRRGLSQYDGYRFLEHPGAKANITGLAIKDEVIYYHDSYVGLCSVRSFYGHPKIIAANQYHDADPNNDHYNNIFVDSGGRIWCSDFNNIKYFNGKGTGSKVFLINKNIDKVKYSVSFLEPQKGKVWAFTEKGVFVWDSKTNRVSIHADPALNRIFSSVKIIGPDAILLGTGEGDVYKYRISSQKLEKINVLPDKKTVNGFDEIKFGGRESLIIYSSENIYLKNDDDQRMIPFYQSKGRLINRIVVNKETNVVWVATNKGLIKLFNSYSSVKNVMLPPSGRRSGNMITDLIEDPGGSIYCSNRSNLIWAYRQHTGWKELSIPDKKIQTQGLFAVGDTLLIATNKGMFMAKDDQVSRLDLAPALNNLFIKRCTVDRNGNLWILPLRQAVQVYSWPDLKLKQNAVVNSRGFWEDNLWNDLFSNTDGGIWLAGWAPKGFGIAVYDPHKHTFNEISNLKANADQSKFVGDYYNRIAKTRAGNLLISGYGGWNLLNKKGEIKQLLHTKKYEVANDRVEGIAEDNNGKIWFGTEEGLQVYNKNTDKVVRISQIDGLPADDLIYGFGKLRNGNIAMGIENGFSLIDVTMMVRSQLINKLELCAIKINGQMINTCNPDIRLQKGETELELLFSSLTYLDKRKIIYRYRFSEDSKWNYLGNKAELSFRHLAPGRYNIILQAGDNLGNWQSKDLRVKVYLPTPFYNTQWFISLVFLSIVIVIICIYRYLLHQHKIEEQYKRKLKEAEMQALRSQMNPHFMFNTLNSINSFIIENKTDEASEYLITFSKLMRDILDNSKHSAIPLKKELQTLKLYLDLESRRLEHIFDYHIKVSNEVSQEILRVPPLILQPFAENAIWHGLRDKDGGGLLEINISMETEKILHIVIKDNGIGRKAAATFMASQFKYRSYGVDITSSRLRLLSNDSSIVTEDLIGESGETAGTAVHIYLNFL